MNHTQAECVRAYKSSDLLYYCLVGKRSFWKTRYFKSFALPFENGFDNNY